MTLEAILHSSDVQEIKKRTAFAAIEPALLSRFETTAQLSAPHQVTGRNVEHSCDEQLRVLSFHAQRKKQRTECNDILIAQKEWLSLYYCF